jgi:serine/threonine protein kinase
MGSGSFGDVFKIDTVRDCVVKVCEVTDKSSREIMTREISIMKMCAHPNVMGLLRNERFGNHVLLWMDFCTPLPYILRERLSSSKLRDYVTDMASGLAYLHEKRIMHRDLKPQNMLVDYDGRLVIADLGLAIQVPDETLWETGRNDASYTREVCTRWWRPPEVLLSIPYTWRIDVWSMGCIVYELVLNFLGVKNAVLLPAPCTRSDDEGGDQLETILHLLGSPSEAEAAYLLDCPHREYAARVLKRNVPAKAIPENMPSEYGEVIGRTLRWVPADRITALDAVAVMVATGEEPNSKRAKTD